MKIIRPLIAAVFLILILWIAFVYMGGYWENMPFLNKISGKQRFEQYIVYPIPSSIYDIHGGYSGFPQGIIETSFRFKEEFSNYAFLKQWKLYENHHSLENFISLDGTRAEKIYRKNNQGEIYILVNEEEKKAKLLVL